jgi:hypothetical protein
MTEAEWLACSDPYPMLVFLNGRASARKMRLFACACCRRILHLLTDERSRKAIELSEQFADGSISGRKRTAAQRATPRLSPQDTDDPSASAAENWLANSRAWATEAAAEALEIPRPRRQMVGFHPVTGEFLQFDPITAHTLGVVDAACFAITGHVRARTDPHNEEAFVRRAENEENAGQAALLRDILGNPFRPVTVSPAGLHPSVTTLARSIYEERAFDRLPILGDALEEAGCANQDLLAHCRHPGEHVRGCWAIDLLLGKE